MTIPVFDAGYVSQLILTRPRPNVTPSIMERRDAFALARPLGFLQR